MTVKTCKLCGAAIFVGGDYHRANARKYCAACRARRDKERTAEWNRVKHADRRTLHAKTRQELTESEAVIFQLREQANLLEWENSILRQRIQALGGFAGSEKRWEDGAQEQMGRTRRGKGKRRW